MELKAVTAKYEVATQLARCKDELRNRGTDDILMWLVAPQVPHPVREFLDRIGIEYAEIHVAEFHRVANRHSTPIRTLTPLPVEHAAARTPDPGGKMQKHREAGIVRRSRDFIKPTIHQLWEEQRNWNTRAQLIEQLKKQLWVAERLDADGLVDMEERHKRIGNWVDWFSAYYTWGKYGLKDEFEQDGVDGTWAYRPRH